MKATEVFVEQVIIGVGALIIGLLPFAPELLAGWPTGKDQLEVVATGAVLVVGAGYLLGIILDRFIDTLLQRLDGHHRLRAALDRCKKAAEVPDEDPFPEGKYRLSVLVTGGEVADWHDYLRSRIRLSRFVVVALPGLTVSAVVAAVRLSREVGAVQDPTPKPDAVAAGLAAVYLLSFLLVVSVGRWLRPAPRTDGGKSKLKSYARSRGFFVRKPSRRAWRLWASLVFDVVTDPALWGAGTLLISAFVLAFHYRAEGAPAPWALPLAGAVLTALAGWSWWRILWTYRRFLRRAARAPKKAWPPKRAEGTA